MSTQILAFNTTTTLCSVALMIDQFIYSFNVITLKRHSEIILSMIDQLLSEVGITLKSLDYIIYDEGPGSFVGVRVGVSVAQGLALGANLPLVNVSSLVVLAQGAWRIFKAKKVITTIDARIGELYWAEHCRTTDDCWISTEYDNNKKMCLATECVIKKLISSLQDNWVLVGTGWNDYAILKYVTANDPIILRSMMCPEAQDMIPIGMYKWKNELFVTPDQMN